MQVDRVEYDAGLQREPAHERKNLGGDVVARQQHHVETVPVLAHPRGNAGGERSVPALHPELPESRCVLPRGAQVRREEHHMRAFADQQAHEVDHAQRRRIVPGARRFGIDHQHLPSAAGKRRGGGQRARRRLPHERFGPLLREQAAVADLVGLDSAAGIGAGGDAFKMHDARGGLVEHAKAARADGKGQIRVFVVGRCVARVEAAQIAEERGRHHDRGPRAVVGLAQAGVARILGRFEAPVVPG